MNTSGKRQSSGRSICFISVENRFGMYDATFESVENRAKSPMKIWKSTVKRSSPASGASQPGSCPGVVSRTRTSFRSRRAAIASST